MANTPYFDHAINEVIPNSKNIKIGVHANLTCGNALYKENILADNGQQDKILYSFFLNGRAKKY